VLQVVILQQQETQLHGYFGGGNPICSSNLVATMDKVTYASDTTAAVPGANLSAASSFPGATGNSTAMDTLVVVILPLSTMDKVTYSSDTTAAVPGASIKCCSIWSQQHQVPEQMHYPNHQHQHQHLKHH
jgi:hypothetical protein